MTRTAIAFALVAMVAWGLWAVFADFATRSLAPEVAMVVSYVAGIGVAVVYVLAQGQRPALSTVGVGYAVLGGLFSGIGAISYYVALQRGSAGVATTVTALYFVVAAVLGVLFLGDSLTTRDAAGIALAVGAVALLST
ncbi:EamA family transporter [Halorussus sp. MSC15.2]|uniref:EamA family transporter n=1 Tax=Halorussus sp. MSC15.2 TaxID=2283638 RepID=UPI0013D37E35|nr:EamA family transporter [Halorussus sp. MSC15.2]NEU58326.1 EamA family transporter [Halorussus sp. MSC15.2]